MTSSELQELSAKIGGQIWGRPDYFVHVRGRHSNTYIFKDKWPEYLPCRIAAQELLGIEDVGFTPSQTMGTVNEWLGIHEGATDNDLIKMLLPHYSFCAAHPGTLEMAYEHDMSGAYWQIVEAAPTPRIRIHKSIPWSLGTMKLDKEQSIRWQRMLEAIGPHKSARLAMVGKWVGRYSSRNWKYAKRWYFVNGEKKIWRSGPSNLPTFGLLIVRLVYELCQEEYLQDNGKYAWVDCVVTESPTPTYWNNIGIKSQPKGAGYFELHRSDIYKIGSRRVGVWFKNMTPPNVNLRPRLISREDYYHRRVLSHWGAIPATLEELPPINRQIILPQSQLGLRLQPTLLNQSPQQPDYEEKL